MKEFLIENIEIIISIVTMIITWICGKLAKKNKHILNNRIPIQNIIIAIVMTGIYYLITGDISMVVASGSPVATLIYDAVHEYNNIDPLDVKND